MDIIIRFLVLVRGVWGFPPHIVAITFVNIPKEYSSGSESRAVTVNSVNVCL